MNIVIYTGASEQIGLGHVYRMLALAEGFRDDSPENNILFATSPYGSSRELIESRGFSLLEFPSGDLFAHGKDLRSHLKGEKVVDVLLMDLFHKSEELVEEARKLGRVLVLIDDLNELETYETDFLVNGNIYAQDLPYRALGDTVLLRGPSYLIIRKNFKTLSEKEKEIKENVDNLMVTFGGSDPENMTLRIVRGLKESGLSFKQVKIVVGGGYENVDALRELIQSKSGYSLHQNVSNMEDYMAEADVAISAAGTTSYELASLGVPSLLFSMADNQDGLGEAMGRRDAAIYCGKYQNVADEEVWRRVKELISDRDLREGLSQKAKSLFDGQGVEKIVAAVKNKVEKI